MWQPKSLFSTLAPRLQIQLSTGASWSWSDEPSGYGQMGRYPSFLLHCHWSQRHISAQTPMSYNIEAHTLHQIHISSWSKDQWPSKGKGLPWPFPQRWRKLGRDESALLEEEQTVAFSHLQGFHRGTSVDLFQPMKKKKDYSHFISTYNSIVATELFKSCQPFFKKKKICIDCVQKSSFCTILGMVAKKN